MAQSAFRLLLLTKLSSMIVLVGSSRYRIASNAMTPLSLIWYYEKCYCWIETPRPSSEEILRPCHRHKNISTLGYWKNDHLLMDIQRPNAVWQKHVVKQMVCTPRLKIGNQMLVNFITFTCAKKHKVSIPYPLVSKFLFPSDNGVLRIWQLSDFYIWDSTIFLTCQNLVEGSFRLLYVYDIRKPVNVINHTKNIEQLINNMWESYILRLHHRI